MVDETIPDGYRVPDPLEDDSGGIYRLIAAERERCAKVLEAMANRYDATCHNALMDGAAAIRRGE